jgi:hypothetical protein
MNKQIERVLYVVRTWVPEDQLEEWNEWHTKVHVPEVVEQPEVTRARKYRVLQDNTPADLNWPEYGVPSGAGEAQEPTSQETAQYVTIYEFNSLEDWESYNGGEAAVRLRKEYNDRYGKVGRISRQALLEVAEVSSFEG